MTFKQITLALALGAASVAANAAPVTTSTAGEWSSSWTGSQYLSSGLFQDNDWEYTFNIANDGFTVGEDLVNDYQLAFSLSDDGDIWLEYARLFQAGQNSNYWEVDFGAIGLEGTARGIAQLNEFGNLTVRLVATMGDFYLRGAELVATGIDSTTTDVPVTVPEPSTLALLGLGLLGLGAARRNQRNA